MESIGSCPHTYTDQINDFPEIPTSPCSSWHGHDNPHAFCPGIRESKLFSAMTKWAEHACVRADLEINAENQRKMLDRALRLIRYPLMTVEEFSVQVKSMLALVQILLGLDCTCLYFTEYYIFKR